MSIEKVNASAGSQPSSAEVHSGGLLLRRTQKSKYFKSVTGHLSMLLAVSLASGQVSQTASTATPVGLYFTPTQIPPVLVQQFLALGSRLTKPGNERITLSGTLTNAAGASNVLIVIELGGKLNITWTGTVSQKVVFDGTTASVSGSVQNSNDLIEAFVDDLPETLMLAVGKGAFPRLLGQKFTNPTGGFCDYYDVATYGLAIKQTQPLVKRYCFDSETSLLSAVRYKTSSSQVTVTQFGGWGAVNNEAVLGTVTRTAGGSQIFQFQAQNAVVSASVADNTFVP